MDIVRCQEFLPTHEIPQYSYITSYAHTEVSKVFRSGPPRSPYSRTRRTADCLTLPSPSFPDHGSDLWPASLKAALRNIALVVRILSGCVVLDAFPMF